MHLHTYACRCFTCKCRCVLFPCAYLTALLSNTPYDLYTWGFNTFILDYVFCACVQLYTQSTIQHLIIKIKILHVKNYHKTMICAIVQTFHAKLWILKNHLKIEGGVTSFTKLFYCFEIEGISHSDWFYIIFNNKEISPLRFIRNQHFHLIQFTN